MRQFVVDLAQVGTYEDFVAAFNQGFCRHVGGHWHGRSWDAFHDYLSWPPDDRFRLVFRGWNGCQGLHADDMRMIRDILVENPHVEAVYT